MEKNSKGEKQMEDAYTHIDEEYRNERLEELQSDCEKKISVLDGFEECLLYYAEDEDGNRRAVYCYEDLVEHFAKTNKCSYIDAVEYVDFNVIRSIPYMTHIGKVNTTTPMIIYRIDNGFSTLDESYFKEDNE